MIATIKNTWLAVGKTQNTHNGSTLMTFFGGFLYLLQEKNTKPTIEREFTSCIPEKPKNWQNRIKT